MFGERLNLHIVWLELWPGAFPDYMTLPGKTPGPMYFMNTTSDQNMMFFQWVKSGRACLSLSNRISIQAQWNNVSTLKSPFHNTVTLPHPQSTHVGHNNSLKHKTTWRKMNAMLLEKRKEGKRERRQRVRERKKEVERLIQICRQQSTVCCC